MKRNRQEDDKKTKTFSIFGQSHIRMMRLLRDFGLLGEEVRGKLEGKERTYRNIAEHCLVVGMVADVIMEKLVEREYLKPEERKIGTNAALIHDLTKRLELETEKGINTDSQKTFLNPEQKTELIANLLEKYRVSKEDVELYHLSKLAGDGILNLDEEMIKITKSPEDLTRWVIFFSDYAVAHTSLAPYRTRFEEANQRGEYNDLTIWWYKKLYGNNTNEIKDPTTIIKKVQDKLEYFLKQTEQQLKDIIGVDKSEDLVDYVKEQIEERYESYAD